jgi:DNA end-binding protein Ku
VRAPEQVDGKGDLSKTEVEMAKSLVENLSEPFDPEKYDDRYRKELLQLIRKKAKGQKLPEPEADEGGEVVDLMEALRESVQQTQRKSRKRPSSRKKTSTRRKTARKAS